MLSKETSDINIVEVGPRDGLQNEKTSLTAEVKAKLINLLADAGLSDIEAGSFVSPKWVPQMASSGDVLHLIRRDPGVEYSALVPNLKGLDQALAAKVDKIAVFTAASEAFCQKNINCSIFESIERFNPVLKQSLHAGIPVRGYVSCIAGCPYQGEVPISSVIKTTLTLIELGCYEVSLGDTIGVGTPKQIRQLLNELFKEVDKEKIAVHFHDTYGMAIANIQQSLDCGVTTIDASISGLGGCPYASANGKAASGNVATEDVVYLLENSGFNTCIDLQKLIKAGHYIDNILQRQSGSKVALALGSQCETSAINNNHSEQTLED